MPVLELAGVEKTFTMHLQGGLRLPVLSHVGFAIEPGRCAALVGPSGIGKSSILKLVYGAYRCDAGRILVAARGWSLDVAAAGPRAILALRRSTIGYVTQFLRAPPRVAAIDVVCDGLPDLPREAARARAADLLRRFNLPERLWDLPPATFSGGEQQRVNLARGLAADLPLLLLDEPTASLDAENRAVVVDIVQERKARGAAILTIVHDETIRSAIADDLIDVTSFAPARMT